ncbi:hypothetical protein [Candidatus Nitronereus thalassa]|uniref:Uncharacterized protein n=1 Tax=Candidatus Nitronereus thalassa TaxID=3020898 RepID=A0ABU3KAY6_9BACT|nr:hypothetical protein [Candidatus Nitronereus thalassa]MDT7043596.1 hypothetical protein [Candidatus Nitronereus thalassa]
MRWVTATDLEQWANTRKAEEDLPLLIRRLVLASASQIGSLAFPGGDSIFRPGWDGQLHAESCSFPVPNGLSVWEFGKNKNAKKKANDDFEKRNKETPKKIRKETTFLFVTPRRWLYRKENKTKWAEEKARKGGWKKVTIIDADNLELWLEQCPGVSSWFARSIGKQPDGVEALVDFWRRVISDSEPELTPDIILAGRESLYGKFENWAEGVNQILRIRADTLDESLLLLCAWAQKAGGPTMEYLFANAVVVHDEEAWRQITATNRPLIFMPLFNRGHLGLGDLTGNAHWVVIPSGWDGKTQDGMIIAPWLEREQLRTALQSAGLEEIKARKLSNNSGRSLQVLMRQLAKAPERRSPPWATPDCAQALIPLLLAGRWNRNHEGDRKVVAELAGQPYAIVEDQLNQWIHTTDAPVRQYGDTYLLASPLDALSLLAPYLTQTAWDRYTTVLINLLSQRDPTLDLPSGHRWAGPIYGMEFSESKLMREGMVEQLVRLAGAEDRLRLVVHPSATSIGRHILSECLSPAGDIERWLSLQVHLPDLAEAAPDQFLDCLEFLLANEESARRLFDNANSLFSTSSIVYIMWAIERVRWFSEHLRRCAEALLKLNQLDPGGNSEPTPRTTFLETFCLREPANGEPFASQLPFLRSLGLDNPEAAWPLLVSLLPGPQMRLVKYPPQFREINSTPDIPETWGEYQSRVEHLLDLLFEIGGSQIQRRIDLVHVLSDLHPNGRTKVMESLEAFISSIDGHSLSTIPLYHQIMKLVRHHRAFSHTDWALHPQEIDRIEQLAISVEPSDPVEVFQWLFADIRPDLLWENGEENIKIRRIEAAKRIFEDGGVQSLERLAGTIDPSGLVGEAIAHLEINQDQRKAILLHFLNQPDVRALTIARSLVGELFRIEGLEIPAFIQRYATSLSDEEFAKFSLGLPSCSIVWDAVEERGEDAASTYWENGDLDRRNNPEEVVRAVKSMLRYHRVERAIYTIAFAHCPVPSDLVIGALKRLPEVLERLPNPIATNNFGYTVTSLFECLDRNNDVPIEKLVGLEIAHFPLIERRGRGYPAIKTHLKNNPGFFVELLKILYPPEDQEQQSEQEESTNGHDEALFHVAYRILNEFDSLPGLNGTNANNEQMLHSWIEQALDVADTVNRKEDAEKTIGGALARADINAAEPWPPEHVCNVLERYWSPQISSGFSGGAVAKPGFRYVGEGEPDAELSAQYAQWADQRRLTHPHVSQLLRSISEWFAQSSHRHRIEAEIRRQT